MARVIDESIQLNAKTDLSVRAFMRIYYSTYHLCAARLFAKQAANLEAVDSRPQFDVEERAYVTATVIAASAFLEAAINEVYADATDRDKLQQTELSSEALHSMRTMWAEFEDGDAPRGLNVFTKYQLCLRLLGKTEIEKDQRIHENAIILVRLRNALTHYKPTYQEITPSPSGLSKLEKSLLGKFPENRRMAGTGNPFLSDRCLGAGCAAWAVRSAEEYADEFFNRISITPNYRSVQF
jgi:hypothetical protein